MVRVAVADAAARHLLKSARGAVSPHNMKQYLVFTYYVGRPLGGAHDFLDSFDSIDEALENILAERNRFYQVVDRDSMQIVKQGLAIFKNFVPEERDDSDDWSGFGK